MAYSNYRKPNGARKAWIKPEPVQATKPTIQPSAYQQAILDWIANDTGNLIVEAVAGSGKTSTLGLIDWQLASSNASRIVVAFNASIAKALQDRGLNGRTFNSVGNGTVQRFLYTRTRQSRTPVEARKVSNIVDERYGGRNAAGFASALVRLVSLAKAHVLRPETLTVNEVSELIGHFDIDWDDDSVDDMKMFGMVRDTLSANNSTLDVIDFDDQLYFVELFNLRVDQFDFVLVDESQDTNPLRRALVARMMSPTSRLIAVGDSSQAIYGFAGASHDSMDLIREQFSCASLPLSICYRCPTSVVALAQTIVPHIEARPGAPAGTVSRPSKWSRTDFRPNDLVICRNTAPIVQTAYRLLAARMPVFIMGREIGQGLVALIRKLSRRTETLESLVERLSDYRDNEVSKALREKKETKAQAIQDKVDSILALVDSMTPEDANSGITGLCEVIELLFADKANATTFATVHKAKGMERERVVILDSHLMPSKFAKQAWQVVQEHNLRYVAYTRSLDTLVFVATETIDD